MNLQFCLAKSFLPTRISSLSLSVLMSSVLTIMQAIHVYITSVRVLVEEAIKQSGTMNLEKGLPFEV